MLSTANPVRHERLSELVTQLSGAPLDRSRQAIEEASSRPQADDGLHTLADALVQVRALVG